MVEYGEIISSQQELVETLKQLIKMNFVPKRNLIAISPVLDLYARRILFNYFKDIQNPIKGDQVMSLLREVIAQIDDIPKNVIIMQRKYVTVQSNVSIPVPEKKIIPSRRKIIKKNCICCGESLDPNDDVFKILIHDFPEFREDPNTFFHCPKCEANFHAGHIRMGEILQCPSCKTSAKSFVKMPYHVV